MRHVFLNKDNFGIRYKTEIGTAWSYLPDKYQNKGIKEIKEFFTQENREDEPSVSFTDEHGQEATYYKVFKDKDYVVCDFNPESRMSLCADDFVSIPEQIEFLKIHSSRELDIDADKLATDKERIALYKKNSDQETLTGLQELIREKMTPEKITEFLKGYGKKYNQGLVVVEFQK